VSKKQPAWVNWSQYVALRTAISVLHSFSVQSTLSTAAGMGALFCRYHRRHLQRAIDNVTLSFPEWSTERVEKVALRSIQNMFQVVMVDAVVMPRLITQSSWQRCLRVGHLQKTMERLIRHQPTIFITGHIGNWELLGYSLAVLGYPLYALARPLDNPLINDWVMGIREARGMRIITKWGAIPALQKVLRNGGRAAFIASGGTAPESPRDDVASLRPRVGRDRPHLERIAALLEAGAVHAPEITTFPLSEAEEAIRVSESRHLRGKLVFEVR